MGLSEYNASLPHVWFHTVSVGESIAAAPMIEAILNLPNAPKVVVTTMTPTGSDRVKALYGDRVAHVYCPWDLPFAIKRFWRTFRPSLVVMMETEVWPNIIATANRHRVPIILANARMSKKSADGYHKIERLVRPAFEGFDLVLAQSKADARRLEALGARLKALQVVGSVKFDIEATDEQSSAGIALRKQLGVNRFCWVAASTHRGEDEQLLKAHALLLKEYPDALLVIVPRHPERFSEVDSLASKQFNAFLRTTILDEGLVEGEYNVMVGNTMGEMMTFFAAADVAVVGGSFIPHGGHNVLEPAALGKPVASGPYVHNFQTICDEMSEQGALEIVPDIDSLAQWLTVQAGNIDARDASGLAALDYLEGRRGALKRQIGFIKDQLPTH